MAILNVDSFKKKHGSNVPALIQIAFLGDFNHQDNKLIETAVERVKHGDICLLDGYIIVSRFEAVAEISLMLPKPLHLENIQRQLNEQALRQSEQPHNIMKMRRYGLPKGRLHPHLEYTMMQKQFQDNTGFKARILFNAISNCGLRLEVG